MKTKNINELLSLENEVEYLVAEAKLSTLKVSLLTAENKRTAINYQRSR